MIPTSGDVCSVNSAVPAKFGIDAGSPVAAVVKDASGRATGELRAFAAMALVAPLLEGQGKMNLDRAALDTFAQDGVNTGTTTLTDLGSTTLMNDEGSPSTG